jgi:hypothetical protein
MRFPGFIGGTYQTRAISMDCQRCVNMYFEPDEMQTAKESEIGSLLGTPGLNLLQSLPTLPNRGVWVGSNNGRVFAVSGNTLYELINTSGTWSYATLGTLNTSTGSVGMSDNGIQLCIVDGPYGYSYTFAENNVLSFYLFVLNAYAAVELGAVYTNNANAFTVLSPTNPAYIFTVASANATVGAIYSNNGFQFTVLSTISSGSSLVCNGTGAPDLNYTFVVSSANATVGAVYKDPDGNAFTVLQTISAGTSLYCSGIAPPSSAGAITLTLSSGTGDATISVSSSVSDGGTLTLVSGTGDSQIIVSAIQDAYTLMTSGNGAPTNGPTVLTLSSTSVGPATLVTTNNMTTTAIPWEPNTAYSLGQIIVPVAEGFQYIVTVAGTSGSTMPTFPTTLNGTVTDGTVIWKRVSTFSQINDPGFLGSNIVCYQDGYFIFAKPGTNQVYSSNLYAVTFNALNFLSLGGSPDPIMNIVSLFRNLYIFTTKTCEIYYDAGISPGFPFARINGAYMQQGMVAQFSLAQTANAIYWLGQDNSGQGVVYTTSQYQPQRISTFAIEESIRNYSVISDAIAYTYQEGGHQFYVLNFPTAQATWAFDVTTGIWHERAYNNNGQSEMQRGIYHGFAYGIHIVADYQNGNIYQQSLSAYTDNGAWIIRKRVSPHIAKDMLRAFYHSFQIDIQQGVGLDGTQQGTDPQVMLRFSDDGARSWSNIISASFGKIGQTKKRAIFRRLGHSRDRVFEVTISDPVFVAITGAELAIELGTS